jgi:hypothetical protein
MNRFESLAACVLIFLHGSLLLGADASCTSQRADLCRLQKEIRQGQHIPITISGTFSGGFTLGTFEDSRCGTESTWMELRLTSSRNKRKLRQALSKSGQAFIVVEGEFYGPPTPDPKLPRQLRESYHPGWGHLAAFRTKLVVHRIRLVNPL